jgi:cytochrome c oxidase subunit 4
MAHNHSSEGHLENGHALPFSTYINVFVTLMVLKVVTVAVSRVDFGVMNIVVAMVVASIKALVVALFFMHLKYEDKVTWTFAVFPIILLFILIGGVFMDNGERTDAKNGVTGRMAMPLNREASQHDHATGHAQ